MALAPLTPAPAAEPVFLPGFRIGLVPPEGMVANPALKGFEDAGRQAVLLITELGAETFAHVDKDFAPDAMKAGGIAVDERTDVALAGLRGYLIVAHQDLAGTRVRKWALVLAGDELTAVILIVMPEAARDTYPDAVLRASLASLVVRAAVPEAEKLGLLPYRFGDLAGFHLVRAIPDGTAILTFGPSDATVASAQPFFMVRTTGGEAPPPAERESFARRMLADAGGFDQFRLVQSGPMRVGPDPGHEIIAEGNDPKNGAALGIVQWLRFGSVGTMQMLGIARREAWAQTFPRMRALRDGIVSK
ncbi:MAG TPA: hypothetical protein VEK73_16370 [Xanthobacteraceae bacterium]|nr:hypothetical protein [Xanthobacteraceae bacterium]